VTVVLDTSVVVALAVADEPDHLAVRDWVISQREELVTTPLVLAEIDHVVERRAGRDIADRVLDDFRDGAYRVHWWGQALSDSLAALRAERRIGIGLVDAPLVALAEHLRTNRIATLDQRHFRRLVVGEDQFRLLPTDA
jgi:predicted nucleic acid-binding protein